ncbi:MAG: transposase, partial [Thermodesulfobacterium geofontis]
MEYAKRYRKVSKKEKSQILDEFTKITGYNRSYASYLLSNHGKIIYI